MKQKTALAALAITYRKKRHDYTQEALAELAEVAVATIKNVETGRPVDLVTLAQIYYHKLKVSEAEWYAMIAIWMKERLGGTINFDEFIKQTSAAEAAEHKREGKDVAGLLALYAKLTPSQRQLIIQLLTMATEDPKGSLLRGVQFLVDYAADKVTTDQSPAGK